MKTKNIIRGNYTPPICTIADIAPEGVLCSSIDSIGKQFDYKWDTEEE